jgi:hypothetical protein
MTRSVFIAPTLLAAVVTLCGCASAPSRPTVDVTRAQTLIQQAEQNGAQRFAAADLDHARDALRRSQVAMDAGNEDVANRLSAEAAVDAELALARSAAGQAAKSAAEVSASIETLRTESQRDVDRP